MIIEHLREAVDRMECHSASSCTARRTVKHLLLLALAVVIWTTAHLFYISLRRTVGIAAPKSLSTFETNETPSDTKRQSTQKEQTFNAWNKAGKDRAALARTRLAENETNPPDSDGASTAPNRLSEREKLVAAAARIKAVFVPPTFKFSNDVYFHPPESGPSREFSRFLVEPVGVCSAAGRESGKDGPFLVVMVLSSYLSHGAREREAIRATYGSVTTGHQWPRGKPLAAPVSMVFLLGTPPTAHDRKQVETESAQFADLLVADFLDSYRNLTLKVLHGLHWVCQHCPQAKFIVKADDDVFLNLPLLTTFLLNRGSANSVYGKGYLSPEVVRKGRWAVARDVYPLEFYPVYMSGTAYTLSIDAAQKIVQASSRLPLVPVEDAFVTGILVQITGIRRIKCGGFAKYVSRKPSVCAFLNDARFVGHGVDAFEKLKMWAVMKIGHLSRHCEDYSDDTA